LGLVAALAVGQEQEDSAAPKRVLKKYRVRRPVIVDEQGNVVRAGPRLRRVRVKKPETAALLQATPTSPQITRTQQTTTTQSQPQQLQQQPQQQQQRQGQREITVTSRRVRPQQPQPQAQATPEPERDQTQTVSPINS
jgi:hypothetical protein